MREKREIFYLDSIASKSVSSRGVLVNRLRLRSMYDPGSKLQTLPLPLLFWIRELLIQLSI